MYTNLAGHARCSLYNVRTQDHGLNFPPAKCWLLGLLLKVYTKNIGNFVQTKLGHI